MNIKNRGMIELGRVGPDVKMFGTQSIHHNLEPKYM